MRVYGASCPGVNNSVERTECVFSCFNERDCGCWEGRGKEFEEENSEEKKRNGGVGRKNGKDDGKRGGQRKRGRK